MNKKPLSIRTVLSALCSALFVLTLTSCNNEDSNSSSSVMVNGTVSSGAAQNAVPIAGATVSIFQAQSTTAKLLATATADASGNFSISIPTDDSGNVYYAIATSGTSTQLMA